MRNFFYAMVLVSLIGFGFFSALKSNAQEASSYQLSAVSFPYQITEIKPSGEKVISEGVSANIDPIKVIPDIKVAYYPEDKILTFPDPKLGFGSTIKIQRAPVISIKDGKRSKQYRSWVTTVGELFSEKGIEIGADDKVSTSITAQIFDGSTISITRVAITNVVEKRSIDFGEIKKDDPNMDKGKTRVERAGVKGEKALTYQVRREDGEEVSRKLIDTTITEQPVDVIVYYGTRPVITVRCKYNDTVIAASIKYKQDANTICNLMMKESNGNAGSVNPNGYYGLFQYELGLWSSASAKAGYAGADWSNPTAQIYTTCYLFSIGQSYRW